MHNEKRTADSLRSERGGREGRMAFKQGGINAASPLWLDEASANCGMERLYGRAPSNERANGYAPDARFERASVMGALGQNGIIAPLAHKGAPNMELFGLNSQNKGGGVISSHSLTALPSDCGLVQVGRKRCAGARKFLKSLALPDLKNFGACHSNRIAYHLNADWYDAPQVERI